MTAQSECPKSAQSPPKAAQRAHTLCVPYVVGTQCAEQLGIGQSEPDSASVVKQPAPQIVSNVIKSQVEQSDEALTFARQVRTRFADCRLTYHATDGRLRGRLPYWWAEVAR